MTELQQGAWLLAALRRQVTYEQNSCDRYAPPENAKIATSSTREVSDEGRMVVFTVTEQLSNNRLIAIHHISMLGKGAWRSELAEWGVANTIQNEQKESPFFGALDLDLRDYPAAAPVLNIVPTGALTAIGQEWTFHWRRFSDYRAATAGQLVLKGAFVPDIGWDDSAAKQQKLERTAAMVLWAEQSQFEIPQVRSAVKSQLKAAANALCRTRDQRWQPVVWSAIRRYASMLAQSEVDTLGDFLDWTWPIDARQVTLQAIQNIFEVAPPSAEGKYQQLRDRVFRMAQAALQPGTLAPGKAAALAMNAVGAVAALGDPRLPQCVQAARDWGRPWFARQVRQVLREFSAGWPAGDPATVQVTEAMSALAAV